MFEILEHPADIGFRAFGGTLEELFANAAVALVSIACEIEEVAPRTEYALSATGTDHESLLVNWLSEGLYWFDGERNRSNLIVKAVTWHQLRIARSDGGWMAEVYLDI